MHLVSDTFRLDLLTGEQLSSEGLVLADEQKLRKHGLGPCFH